MFVARAHATCNGCSVIFAELATTQPNGTVDVYCAVAHALEQQIESPIAELIVGVSRDASGLMLLTLGSGGIYAELIKDVTHLLLPTTANAVYKALSELKLAPLLKGYRGRPAANMDLVVAAIMAIDAYVVDQGEGLLSLDVNPLMVTPTAVFAVDALIEFV